MHSMHAHDSSAGEGSLERLSERAKHAFERGDHVAAASVLHEIVARWPSAIKPRLTLGKLLLQLNRVGEAAGQYAEATRQMPDNAAAWIGLANCHGKAADLPAASEAYAAACRLEPSNVELWLALARTQAALGSTGDAANGYRRVLAMRPDDCAAHEALGVLEIKCDRYADGVSILNWAQRLGSDRADIALCLADGLAKLNRVAEAEAVLRATIQRDPSDLPCHLRLAAILVGSGRTAESIAVLTTAAGLGRDKAAVYLLLAKSHARQGNRRAALDCLDRIGESRDVDLARLAEPVGYLALSLGDRQRAARGFADAARAATTGYDRALLEGMAAWSMDDLDAADRAFATCSAANTRLSENPFAATGDTARLSDRFFRDLEPLAHTLGESFEFRVPDGVTTQGRNVFFLSVDQRYFEQYRAVLIVNRKRLTDARLHIHVVNPADAREIEAFGKAVDCVVSWERVDFSGRSQSFVKAYYACIRFVRAAQMAGRLGYEILGLVDADAAFAARIEQVFSLAAGNDLGLLDSGGAVPWVAVNASLTLVAPTPVGRRYLDLVARYIARFVTSGDMRWRLDQCALFGTLHYMVRANDGLKWARIGESAVPFIGFGKVHDRAFVDHVAHGLKPDDAKIYQQLAAVMVVADRRIEAEVLLREALRLDPDSDQVKLALGRLLLDLDQLDETVAILRTIREDYVERARVLKALRDARLRAAFKEVQAIHEAGTAMPARTMGAAPQSDLAEFMSARLRDGMLQRSPCPHFVQDGIFPPEVYAAMVNAVSGFTGWAWGGNHEYPDRGDAGFDDFDTDVMGSVGRALNDPAMVDAAILALGGGPLRDALAERGYRLVTSARVTRDRTNYALGPHRDHHSRFGSILFYLPADDSLMAAGTALYVPKRDDLKFDYGRHYPFSDFQVDRIVPFRPNSCLAFLNFGAAYHGVERIRMSAWRHVIQFTIYIRPDDAAAPPNG